jgi:hypothetical protein
MRKSLGEQCLIITVDGYGDLTSCSVHVGARNRLTEIARTPFTDSIGSLYSLVTGAMGFVLLLEHMANRAYPRLSEDRLADYTRCGCVGLSRSGGSAGGR